MNIVRLIIMMKSKGNERALIFVFLVIASVQVHECLFDGIRGGKVEIEIASMKR